MLHDLRQAVRLLRTSPGYAAVSIATIALAIGANTAMFTLVHGLLLKPLPYPDSDRIVRVLERLPTGGLNGVSTLNYLDWANQNTVFEHLAAEAAWRATWTGGGEPVVLRGARVSAAYFDVFGADAAIGRTFLPGEDQPGHDRVVVLNHVLWTTRFGADPALPGRAILLNGEPHTVVGVLREGGPFDRAAAQIWKPLAFEPAGATRDYRWLGVSGKLRAGVTLERARAEMDAIGQRLAGEHPGSNKGWGVAVDRLADVLISPHLRTGLAVLFAATLFVLLIGCANMANLALARSMARESEIAVRAALGARRWHLVRHLLIENLVIAACGGVVGVGVGYALLRWILWLIPADTLPPAADIGMEVSVLLYTAGAAAATGLVFGVAPAARSTRPALVHALKAGAHGTMAAGTGRRLRSGVVVAEIALAFVLLVASGLLMRSFSKLLDVDPGFDATNVLTAGLPVDQQQHPDPVELNAYLASIRAAVHRVPGVRDTALASALPLQGWGFGVPYSIAGRAVADGSHRRRAFFKIVTPSYFDTLGMRLLAGRGLLDSDTAGAQPVAVINETLARREFPAEDPIGRLVLVPELVPGRTDFGRQVAWAVVGVVAGEKVTGLGDEISAGMYVSNEQSPTYAVNLLVRAGVPPESLQRAIRSALDGVNRDQALSDVRTLEQIIDRSLLANRVTAAILAMFAALAVLLAAVGVYGVVSYTAARRTYELGVRAALGASATHLRTLIFTGGMRLTAIGLSVGLAATFATTHAMAWMLYGVAPDDALTIAAAAGVLSGIAGLACFLPAWRITRADPVDALRSR